ncbi:MULTISPECIES: alpha/beta hydrolase [Pseudomonadota]|jgi:pimeloyl-ACP methyl ester carboxylesterase|uniref:alpha/beta fold hydrolase n=1 Tax=Pseudomonadota TaxID=1224 RepID=UPI0009EB53E2|nr:MULTISPECIES: alpha/beta hydrolase [Pseudomonadota]
MANFLLMHGGGMGGWTWKHMRAVLEAEGHTVFTPTFTGFGERIHLIGRDVGNATHVTDIVNVLHYEDLHDVILVAHSYAGTVAPGVLAQAGERIRRVIFLDAIIAHAGERILSLLGFASEADMTGLDALLDSGQGPVGSGVHEQQRAMAREHPHMMDRNREQWLLDRLSDQPMRATCCAIAVGAESITHPADYIAAQHTIMTPMHERARALGWPVHDHPGDHAFNVGDPEGVAKIMLEIIG